ncbi:MAG TPA: hypothetical protein VJH67_01090 [Candidatus Paceibacterota bacterium]
MENNSGGNSTTNTLLIIVVLILVGVGVWYFTTKYNKTEVKDDGASLEIKVEGDSSSY